MTLPVSDNDVEFTQLLEPLLDAAYGLALHLSRNPADADDVVQEAALLAYRHFARFERGSNFRAWFFRILVNCFYSRYRKGRREQRDLPLDDASELHLFVQSRETGLHAQTADPATLLMSRLDADLITDAIASLPDEFRAVCSLYLVQDLAYKEIASMLELPIGTVRSRLHRGRRLLQRALWSMAVERGIIHELTRSPEADDGA